MLDVHQFTLLIVAVGLGALLVSFSLVYREEVDVLTARLEALQGESSAFKEQGNPEANVALTKQKTAISQRLESLTLSLRHSLVSVLLLLFFLTKTNVEAPPFGRGGNVQLAGGRSRL